MMNTLFQRPAFQEIMISHIGQTIEFLFENNQEFSLACETEFLTFSPDLPTDISDSFGQTVLFILKGYTFETAQLEDGFFSFEAGFGEENFGSTVMLPLLAIKQIFVGEYPVAINISEPSAEEEMVELEIDTTKSMEALLNNPENKKFLKKS